MAASGASELPLLQRVHARTQAGLITRRGILVDYALLNRLIESGNGLSENQIGTGLIAFRQSVAQITQSAAQPGGIGAVADTSFLSLKFAMSGSLPSFLG
jgi:hypothetical protein